MVVVTGARQTGKSTLARRLVEGGDRTYYSLDDLEILERARREPDALVRSGGRLTFDEVQRSPDLLLAVKRAVDDGRVAGRYLLTGSANLLLMKRIADSLAGRAVYLTLGPMTRGELAGAARPGAWRELFATPEEGWPEVLRNRPEAKADWRVLAVCGGYPVPAHHLRTEEERELWFAGYTQTYLERDLRDLSSVSSLVEFRQLMRAACLRLGTFANQTEMARDLGITQPTVGRHLSLLETSYQLVRVPAYFANRTKRLIKAPKIYWVDTGLALFLSGESQPRGEHLENLILADLLAWQSSEVRRPEVYHWRTATGDEVDLVIEWKGEILPVEIKSTPRPSIHQAKSLARFLREQGARAGLLLHAGEEIEWIADGVLAAPWWRVI